MGCNGNVYHIPVLLKEVLNGLDSTGKRKVIVDATAGGMGHSSQLAKTLPSDGTLICIDQDAEALTKNEKFIKENKCRIEFIHDNFANIKGILHRLNIDKTDAVLADLGVSSYQIDSPQRGFSYTKDAPLDMRMNQSQKRDAYHVVNNYTPARLQEIIQEFGEERYAKAITAAIVKNRPLKTTGELAKVITDAVLASYYKTGGHPAKRTFQAIRIEVNRELEMLERFLTDAAEMLSLGGRIAVITFHSLEDRIVKRTFKHLSTECICPPKTPKCICNHKATLKILTKKPIEPTSDEVTKNPRATSAKLRIAERI